LSKDNVKLMFGKMEKDANLQKKYAELMQIHQKETENTLAGKLIELGKTSGFIFSQDDLLAARAEFMDQTNSNKELSDNDLVNVAGGQRGKLEIVGYSIISFGVICAGASIIAEIGQAGGCGSYMSTTRECPL